MPRSWIALAAFATGLAVPGGPSSAAEPPRRPNVALLAEPPRRPNVLVILSDDLGHADLGFNGCRDIPTPNLDALAARGVRCTNGYVSGPYCSPTRAGLLTGRYQQRFGHEFNPGDGGKAGLPLGETTLVDRFKAAGYATGLVGKWHLGAAPEFHPNRRGFDEFYGFLGGAHPYRADEGGPIFRGTAVVEEREYLTDAIARESVAFIDRHKDKPFLLEVAFNAVHTPMQATDARLARFASISDPTRRTYAAMLSAMDEAIGRVLDALRAANLEGDTLVFFLSDNGGPTLPGTTINGSRNDPFRGSKRTTLEGGIRVPFVAAWKGHLPEGTTCDRPVIQLDILPTALHAAGITPQADWQLDGVDILPALKGEAVTPPHETLYWRFGEQSAIRRGDWKLVRYDVAVDTPGVRSRGPTRATPARLYNLATDPGERNDLATEHADKAAELLVAWRVWDAQLVPPLWGAGTPAARARTGRAKAEGRR